ncbi:late cornified envelope-like proline-rich protein 1 [Apis laboriosa]|uniref:late cornified envelope-like proline-rich protein 1 n=1 Tax=Apis laboriosa TaxID=183418 RepID=UPI001CC39607|nr:late cornified envelope-like proline-rich protein 1 [Apis laboriosa]
MSVIVKCIRPYGKKDLKQMIESCGCCPPMDPQCPPLNSTPCPPQPICTYTCSPPIKLEPNNCCPSMPITSMPCPSEPPLLPCAPRSFVCPPCTGRPCITCAPLPKPVPAPFEVGPVYRAPVTTGGLFYMGTIRCYPCLSYAC